MNNLINKNIKITDRIVQRHNEGKIRPELLKRHERTAKLMLKYVDNKNAYILDIGAREGLWLHRIKKYGYNNSIGIDISKKAIKELEKKGINGIVMAVEDMKFKDETFDVINISHVLEHCKNSAKVLGLLDKVIKVDGICIIEVPIEKFIKPSLGHHTIFKKNKELLDILPKNFKIIETYNKVKNRKRGTIINGITVVCRKDI